MQVLRDLGDRLGADDGAACARRNVCEERDDEEGLLGAVEVVDEEVPVFEEVSL
ncbi:hypothetical protein IMZ48_16190 [Candidatus Bathyarchaeota archaeon]|nr:hypothetical protein [Candidatus Bathyarchaeota archaeon]